MHNLCSGSCQWNFFSISDFHFDFGVLFLGLSQLYDRSPATVIFLSLYNLVGTDSCIICRFLSFESASVSRTLCSKSFCLFLRKAFGRTILNLVSIGTLHFPPCEFCPFPAFAQRFFDNQRSCHPDFFLAVCLWFTAVVCDTAVI